MNYAVFSCDLWLNTNVDGEVALLALLIAYAVWATLWEVIIRKLLEKYDPASSGYELYKIGSLGTFGMLVFCSLVVLLFIITVQAVVGYGLKMLIPLALFWGSIITAVVLIVRYINKKK